MNARICVLGLVLHFLATLSPFSLLCSNVLARAWCRLLYGPQVVLGDLFMGELLGLYHLLASAMTFGSTDSATGHGT